MTKLLEWLSGTFFLVSIWLFLLNNNEYSFVKEHYRLILYSPIIFLFSFGVYSASVVLYRVYAFNNCEQAAVELQKEIKEANEELNRLGFNINITEKSK